MSKANSSDATQDSVLSEPVRPLEALIERWRYVALSCRNMADDAIDAERAAALRAAAVNRDECANELTALLQAAPTADKCPTCGAPTLKPGERHAKVLPPRAPTPFYLERDEDCIPEAAPPERVSEGKEP
jgi:hypothetical protein